jgi:hypothetical protein
MAEKVPALLFAVLAISIFFADVSSARPGATPRWYPRYRPQRGIDDGMVRQPPQTGDEKMVRKAPENIDDGIFKPNRIVRKYPWMAQPKAHKK